VITRTFSFADTGSIRIGRGKENDLILTNPLCSRCHARIERAGRHFLLHDENSTFGTFRNGIPARADSLSRGDRIQIGTQELCVISMGESLALSVQEASDADPSNQSSTLFQQSVQPHGGGITVFLKTMDARACFCGPRGEERNAALAEGDRLAVDGDQFAVWNGGLRRVPRAGTRIDAVDICKEFRGRRLLTNINLAVKPGEFVGLLGPSGAGKTSLLRILSGLDRPASGCVDYDAVPLSRMPARPFVGFVPQDDLLHESLSGREMVEFAVRLHALRSIGRIDFSQKTQSVLDVLGLAECADRPVRFLSSGQRKRVSLAMEMAVDPQVLALDEPTANLDPGLEAKMIELLRRISDHKRTVLVSTHRLGPIQGFDLVGVVHGGHLVFYGPPALLQDFFGCGDIARIYEQLGTKPAHVWAERFRSSALHHDYVAARLAHRDDLRSQTSQPAARVLERRSDLVSQFVLATKRALRLARRDAWHWGLVLLQAPLIAGLILLVFARTSNSWPLLFCMGISSIWFGCINSVKEICKEKPLVGRERRIGLRVGPYLASKVGFLSALSLIQIAVLVSSVNLVIPLEGRLPLHFVTFGLLSISATAMGLLLSAGSAKTERALAGLPILLIPQILFAGAVAPFDEMPAVSQWISRVTLSRWGFTAAKKITFGFQPPWNEWAALSAMAVMFIFIAFLLLRRKG